MRYVQPSKQCAPRIFDAGVTRLRSRSFESAAAPSVSLSRTYVSSVDSSMACDSSALS